MSTTNSDLAERACALAESSEGLLRMAALCVSAAAATTGTFRGARRALEVISHSGLREAAHTLLSDLAVRPAAAETATASRKAS